MEPACPAGLRGGGLTDGLSLPKAIDRQFKIWEFEFASWEKDRSIIPSSSRICEVESPLIFPSGTEVAPVRGLRPSLAHRVQICSIARPEPRVAI